MPGTGRFADKWHRETSPKNLSSVFYEKNEEWHIFVQNYLKRQDLKKTTKDNN